ncbi:hypothetical protein LCGC14_1568960, partial [marine sediment metagenome]
MYKFCNDYEKMFENIVGSAHSYIASNKIKALVIGMSGGIDSTLTAALAQEVVKRLDNNILLEGRVIDIESNKNEIDRGFDAAIAFCDGYQQSNLIGPFQMISAMTMERTQIDAFKTNIRLGNIKARIRMIKLYDLANELDGMVLSTDNYTEYLLGFWTLHGDVGDFGMIQNLWKTEVYGLAEYLVKRFNLSGRGRQADALKECMDAVPTDGLGVTNSDFDQIYPHYDERMSHKEVYQEIDQVLRLRLSAAHDHSEIVKRHRATEFKRNNPFNIPREYIV